MVMLTSNFSVLPCKLLGTLLGLFVLTLLGLLCMVTFVVHIDIVWVVDIVLSLCLRFPCSFLLDFSWGY